MKIKDIIKKLNTYFLLIFLSFIFFLFRDIKICKIISIFILIPDIYYLAKKNISSILIIIPVLLLYKSNYIDSYVTLTIYLIGMMILYHLIKLNINRVYKYDTIISNIEVERGKKSLVVPLEKVKKGDIITIKKDELIVFDGTIVNGKSTVVRGYLSGKEDIIQVKKNTAIESGSKNLDKEIKLRVATRYKDTKFYKTNHILSEKIKEKSNLEKRIDILSILMIIVLLFIFVTLNNTFDLALISFIILSILNVKEIVRYVINLGIIDLYNKNVYIKSRDTFIDTMNVKNLYLEKTGVITTGKLRITKLIGSDKNKLLYYLAYGEANSTTPIAEVIKKYSKLDIDLKKIKKYEEIQGKGIKYRIDKDDVLIGNYYFLKDNNVKVDRINNVGTIVYVVVNKLMIGAVVISDSIKNENRKSIFKLRRIGIKNIVVLSGDNENIVNAICNEVGITDYYSNSTKEEKMFWYTYLNKKYKGKSMYISNYNQTYSNIDTDFNCSINNDTLTFNNYDIITKEDDLNILVEIFKKALLTKDALLKIILMYILFTILLVLLLILNINYVYLYVLINIIIMGIMITFNQNKEC